MSNRRFEIVKTPEGTAERIKCRCGAISDFFTSRSGLDHNSIPRVFAQRGWHVGRSRSRDLCPDCKRKGKHQHQPEEQPQMAADTKIVDIRSPQPGASDQPPRQMSREDRRLIFAKLEEVYVDEGTGYTKGWHDERVAQDMAVPRSWVEVIREENFGPIKAEQNPEVAGIKIAVEEIERVIGHANRDLAAIGRESREIAERQKQIEAALSTATTLLQKSRAELAKLTGRA